MTFTIQRIAFCKMSGKYVEFWFGDTDNVPVMTDMVANGIPWREYQPHWGWSCKMGQLGEALGKAGLSDYAWRSGLIGLYLHIKDDELVRVTKED